MSYYIFNMTLKIYLLDYKNIPLDVLLNSQYISPMEKESFNKYTVEAVRKEKIASTYMKNKYIGKYHRNENGKPISEDKCFNLSHSHGVIVLVIDTVPVGIDIELTRQVEDDLKRFVTNEGEALYVHDETSFYEIWTNKEATVKADGVGIKERPDKLPGLPINGQRVYKDKTYNNRTIKYGDYVITVSRESIEDFSLDMNLEVI